MQFNTRSFRKVSLVKSNIKTEKKLSTERYVVQRKIYDWDGCNEYKSNDMKIFPHYSTLIISNCQTVKLFINNSTKRERRMLITIYLIF